MTRKDYRQLAEDLRIEFKRLETEEERNAFCVAVGCMADALKRNNPRFDREKFHEAFFTPAAA
jgi:hypothetical protein